MRITRVTPTGDPGTGEVQDFTGSGPSSADEFGVDYEDPEVDVERFAELVAVAMIAFRHDDRYAVRMARRAVQLAKIRRRSEEFHRARAAGSR